MCCVFLLLLLPPEKNDQNRNTAKPEQRTRREGEGGGGVDRGDIFLLLYEVCNSTNGMMLQSDGKPSAQQEDDSIKVLAGRWRCG